MITKQSLTDLSTNQTIPLTARGVYLLLLANADESLNVSPERLQLIHKTNKAEKAIIDSAIVSLEAKKLVKRKRGQGKVCQGVQIL
jgi:hypothetical protein